MNVVSEQANQLAKANAREVDDILMSLLQKHTGKDVLDLSEITMHGKLKTFPDGTETFSYKGTDLVTFWPIEFQHIEEDGFCKLKTTRKYLYL